jgi:hypothetical protein
MVNFELFGDSNISRNWKSVASDQDRLKGSVLRPTTTLVLLKDNLRTVSQTTKFIIVAALSNPVSRLKYDGSEAALLADLDTLFDDVLDLFTQTVNCNPELQVLLSLAFCIL